MLRLLYENVDENLSVNEIAFDNLKSSDLHFNKETVICSSIAWLKNDKSRTFQDLELLMRKHNLNTHLIAYPFNYVDDDKITLESPNPTDEILVYECVFCCKPEEFYLEDLNKMNLTMEDNFEKLLKCGTLKVSTHSEDHNEVSLTKKLCENKIKLNFVKLSPKESIEQLFNDITKATGKKPKPEIVGKYNDKQPIITFLLENGEFASHIGWTVEEIDNDLKYTLLDLNTCFSKEKL